MAKKDQVKETPEGLQVYELGYLLLPSIAEDKLSAATDKLKTLVEKLGGTQIDGEEPFKINLAYTMSKTINASRYVVNDAYIGWLKFELDPMQALALKTEVDKMDEVLRSLIIKAPRETHFSFAQAKALIDEAKAEKEGEVEEVSEVAEPVVE